MKTRKATELEKLNFGEYLYFKRLITEVYPTGFVSIVSDTWDYWKVITEYLPKLKDVIMNRDGRVVIRPDSGDPVKIIAGCIEEECDSQTPEHEIKGTYEIMWEIFGGTINEKGYKVLDTHIGLIYGDSITLERQEEIYKRLEAKGFAATNLVLGIGSFSYQLKSRDSLGFAMKATYCVINDVSTPIFKKPKTDSGMKNSLKGLIRVDYSDNNKIVAIDEVSLEMEGGGLLRTVYQDGILYKDFTLSEIRENVNATIL